MTLNQIKYLLIGFFESHRMINQVFYGDKFDFSAVIDLNYPVVNIEYLNSNISNKVMNHNFKIIIGDITQPNNADMEDLIYSDSLQIAEDFYTYLSNYTGNLIFDKVSSIQKFNHDMPDIVCGIVFSIRLGTMRPQNICATEDLIN